MTTQQMILEEIGTERIKRCLHCGDSGHLRRAAYSGRFSWQIKCACGIETSPCRTGLIALMLWNRRPPRKPKSGNSSPRRRSKKGVQHPEDHIA